MVELIEDEKSDTYTIKNGSGTVKLDGLKELLAIHSKLVSKLQEKGIMY
ncbi:MAG: hypothetical protein PH343_07040 [Nitrospira sp.]|nr:hypothetical protein [Nitrospira sp.]